MALKPHFAPHRAYRLQTTIMILTLTCNPAIDKSAIVDTLVPEKKMRCSQVVREPGGGGINVSKALQELGGQSHALFPAGGANGALLSDMVWSLGIAYTAIGALAETREDLTIWEQSTQRQYRFVMPGAHLTPSEMRHFLKAVMALKPLPDIVVASGSLPPGMPDGFLADLANVLKDRGTKLVVDTSGPPLQLAAKAGVYLLKPNLAELCALTNRQTIAKGDVAGAAKEIIDKGHCELMVVSMGQDGALLVEKNASTFIPAPKVEVRSTVGAGDSMVAGMVWMMEQGGTAWEMAAFGVACGTAATMNPGTRLFERKDALRLYDGLRNNA